MSWSKNAMTSQRARTTTLWTPRLSLLCGSATADSFDSHRTEPEPTKYFKSHRRGGYY